MTLRRKRKQLRRSRLRSYRGLRRLLVCLAFVAFVVGLGMVCGYSLHKNAKLLNVGLGYLAVGGVCCGAQYVVRVFERLRKRRMRGKERDG